VINNEIEVMESDLDLSNWCLKMVLMQSMEGKVMKTNKALERVYELNERVLAEFTDGRIFELRVSEMLISLTWNVAGNLRGMTRDENNMWWENFLELSVTEVKRWEGMRMIFFWVNLLEQW
jgi:hypothetical protein